MAVLLALGITELCLPKFNFLTGRELALDVFGNWTGMFAMLGLVLGVGLLSGIYPALLLSKFNPIGIIKGNGAPGFGSDSFRRILVVAQFTVSTILIVGIGIIYQQLNFLHGKNLGFDKEQVLFVEARPPVNAKFEAFWEALLKIPGIRKVGGTSNIPGEGMYAYRFIPQDGSADEPKMLPLLLVDYDFFDTMNIAVKQGRGISRLHPSDQEEGFLLNEKAAEQLGWQDDPIGKTMSLFAPGTNEIWKSGSVIGVIENYHFESLHNEVKPLVVTYTPQHFAYRTEIGWQVFALAGGLGLLITILTVSTQSVRAALANPIESLRYE